MILADVAHARAGDKGAFVTIVVIPHAPDDYPLLAGILTGQALDTHLGWLFPEGIVRTEISELGALLIVGARMGDDTVTVSLAADRHGKSAAGILLAMEIPASAPAERPHR